MIIVSISKLILIWSGMTAGFFIWNRLNGKDWKDTIRSSCDIAFALFLVWLSSKVF